MPPGDTPDSCKLVQKSVFDPVSMQCSFDTSQYPLSIPVLIDQLNHDLEQYDLMIDDTSRFWAEALGGHGKRGKVESPRNGGSGGQSGYARMGTTVGELLNDILADNENIYLLVGEAGKAVPGQETGGTGGAATLILGLELTGNTVETDPVDELVLVIAAGGGGGGAATFLAKGKVGGDGADAISTEDAAASVMGENGRNAFSNGKGGNGDGMGSGGSGFNDGTDGIGGKGGRNGDVEAGWGIVLEWLNGKGGTADKDGRGGAGGGGFGGGGAGTQCQNVIAGCGGGGGGSWARQSTVDNETGPFAGKEAMLKESGQGSVVLTFETAPVDTEPPLPGESPVAECGIVQDFLNGPVYVRCVYISSLYPLSMSELIGGLNEQIDSLELMIDDTSTLWIEAMGGRGARGPVGTHGGLGGYARTAQTVAALLDDVLIDGDSMYLLVGSLGAEKGDGGSASIVSGKDLRIILEEDIHDPDGEHILAIAGGGGGHGLQEFGKLGGSGNAAISTFFDPASVAGGNGRGAKDRGDGANKDGMGEGGDGHHSGVSGIGGKGGKSTGENTGWVGLDLIYDFGKGGNSSDKKGGGGGGGFGGGGAGKEFAGGGAGGSWARQSTALNSEGGFIGELNLPLNDDNGVVVLTFETIPF
jgi:hypothetical protein